MTFPQEKESTKISALKGMILPIVLSIHFEPTYTTPGTVTAVGYKGVTVEYKGEYGQDLKKEINVDNVTEYQIGDTVTIEIKALNVEIVEERDDYGE